MNTQAITLGGGCFWCLEAVYELVDGVTAVVAPIPAEARFVWIDMPWDAASAIGLTVVAALLGGLPRIAGTALLAAYGGYLVLMT